MIGPDEGESRSAPLSRRCPTLRVNKPRLRRKGRGAGKEVSIPAYRALRHTATGERMLEILLNGVSTRRYQRVIPEMADTVGVSRSTVSRRSGRSLRGHPKAVAAAPIR